MPRWPDDDSDDWEADDVPDDEEGSDDGLPTAPCPYCGRAIYDDAVQCPGCGRYLSREDRPPAPRPWWIVLGVVAALYALLRLLF